jgi:DNA-binding MarR family transcriptional regulator
VTANSESYIKEPIGRIMGEISRLFLANLHHNLAHLDIKRSFYPLLLIEAANGKLTQQELAQKLSCNKVQVVRIVDYLSSRGYVTRIQDSNDRRKCNLSTTDKAKESLPDIKKAICETTSLALEQMPEKEVNELYFLLKTIEINLSPVKNIYK